MCSKHINILLLAYQLTICELIDVFNQELFLNIEIVYIKNNYVSWIANLFIYLFFYQKTNHVNIEEILYFLFNIWHIQNGYTI